MTKISENRHDRATAAATAPITGLAILEPADAGTATAATAAERSTRQETVTATYMGSHHGGIVLPLTLIGIAAGTAASVTHSAAAPASSTPTPTPTPTPTVNPNDMACEAPTASRPLN